MDGLSVAARIIQVIDVASRLVANSVRLYQSADGQLIENQELAAITQLLSDNGKIFIYRSTSNADRNILQTLNANKKNYRNNFLQHPLYFLQGNLPHAPL
jgi:hypothetical protein